MHRKTKDEVARRRKKVESRKKKKHRRLTAGNKQKKNNVVRLLTAREKNCFILKLITKRAKAYFSNTRLYFPMNIKIAKPAPCHREKKK